MPGYTLRVLVLSGFSLASLSPQAAPPILLKITTLSSDFFPGEMTQKVEQCESYPLSGSKTTKA
jgi:hypothetical protein